MQEMADPLDGAVLDLREPGVEQGPAFDEQLHRLGPEDREDRLEDGGRLLGTERPGGDGWEFDAEEGVGVLDRLGDATRDVLIEYSLAEIRSWSPTP